MSRVALLLVVPLMIACTKKDAAVADTSAATAETTALAPGSYAGNWTVNVRPEGKDSILLTYALESTSDMTGWKMTLPGREVMDLRVVSMDDDSVVIENGPYSSALRKDIMVTTRSSMRKEGDKLVGKTIARYNVKTADSVVMLQTEATRR